MKQINNRFLVLAIALIFSLGTMAACDSAAEKSANEKTSGEPAQNNPATGDKSAAENKSSENKNAENKTAPETRSDDSVDVYDGRTPMSDAKLLKATKTDEEMVRTEFKAKESEIKKRFGDRYCDESDVPDITGVGKGSFTKPNSSQTAFAYTVCSSGSSQFGVGGMMIFEDGKIVSHYTYGENGLLNGGVFTLPDINKNGLTEFVLMDGQMHQGYSSESIEILEFKDGNLSDLGGITVATDNSGAAEDDSKVEYEASKISVKPSANPMFYVVTYQRKGVSKEWTQSKKTETNSLEKNFGKNYKIS